MIIVPTCESAEQISSSLPCLVPVGDLWEELCDAVLPYCFTKKAKVLQAELSFGHAHSTGACGAPSWFSHSETASVQ